MLDNLISDMEKAIQEVRRWPGKEIQIYHHNDADGLCSAAILTRAFEREGYTIKRISLEKPYPAVLEKIFEQEGRILIFADFAGRIAPRISQLNRGRNLTLILDHHAAEPASGARVHNLDPELYGFKGDRDVSASTTCYLFAQAMDAVNGDMAHIAALGAVADGFFVNGELASLNRDAALEAVQQGRMKIRKHETGEDYLLSQPAGQIACAELGKYLDTLGGVGYFKNGTEMGVRVCVEGISDDSERMMADLRGIMQSAFNEEVSRLQKGDLKKTPHIQWFKVDKRFYPMGVKVIGLFCEYLREMDFIDPQKYIAGFQIIPDEIPGFGSIRFGEVKISMRVAPFLEEEIRAERRLGLNTFLPEATSRLGGFSDACHRLTAATVVAIGKEEELIMEMEKILQGEAHG